MSAAPEVTVNSEAQANNLMASCLRALGWDVTVSGSGGVGADFPNDQLDKYMADHDACSKGIAFRSWTSADFEKKYASLVAVNSCLQAVGYPTPATVPSLQTFTEQYQGGSTSVWDPYSLIAAGDMPAALAACPQPPPIY